MKKIFYVILISFVTNTLIAQETVLNNEQSEKKMKFSVGLGLNAGTNGLGFNAVAALNDKLALRLGYDNLDLSLKDAFSFPQDNYILGVSPTVKLGGISAIFDYYLLRWFYVSAGVMVNNFNLSAKINSMESVKIGDIEYFPNEMGEMNAAIKMDNKLSPYFGIGFGRNIAKKNRLGFSFELGAYHGGSYAVDVSGTNFFRANGEPSNLAEIDNLNNVLRSISWSGIWPVVKLGISYKIWKQK